MEMSFEVLFLGLLEIESPKSGDFGELGLSCPINYNRITVLSNKRMVIELLFVIII